MAWCIRSSAGGVEQHHVIRKTAMGCFPGHIASVSEWAPSDSGSYSRAERKYCWSVWLSFLAESFSVERPLAPSPL